MNILILTNKLPYPPRDGGSIATLNMITGLRDTGHSITCLALNTAKHSFPVEKIPPELRTTVHFIGIPCDSSIKPLRMVLNLVFSGKPYIAERFNIRNFREKLEELLKNESFDLIQLEGVTVASKDSTLTVTVQYLVRRTQQRQVAQFQRSV